MTIKESDPTIPPELQKMTESSDTSIDAVIFRFDSKIVVALRSEACFAVPKSSVQSVQRLSDTRLSFELETLLPIDAEEMAVRRVNDLIVVTNKSIAQSIVDTEEDQGKWIGGVSPLVFLALEEWISCTNKSQLALPSAYQILWMSDQLDYSDLVSISNGMGLTVMGCLQKPECRAAIEEKIRELVEAMDDTARAALYTACQVGYAAYKAAEKPCRSCRPSLKGKTCWQQINRCFKGTLNAPCWATAMALRYGYIASGCDEVYPPSGDHVGHAKKQYDNYLDCLDAINMNCNVADGCCRF